MRLRQDVARSRPAPSAAMSPVVAAQLRDAASASAAAGEAVTAAIEGDLIAASPALSAKIAEFDERIGALEEVP